MLVVSVAMVVAPRQDQNEVYAYAVDYEGDVNSLFPLKKVDQNTFENSQEHLESRH